MTFTVRLNSGLLGADRPELAMDRVANFKVALSADTAYAANLP